jgi:hypothetical protein
MPVELPTTVQIWNGGNCAIQPFNATVFYTAAFGLVPATFTSADGSALDFDIVDALKLDNVTFSFGAYIQPGTPGPILRRYNDAVKGSNCLIARMHLAEH